MNIQELTIEERIKLVEDIWDSIASEQGALQVPPSQRAELDLRLERLRVDGNPGTAAGPVIERIRGLL